MKRLAPLIALATVAATAQAAPETYTIDNSHTYPQFTYTHLGFSKQTHKFDKTSGKVVLDRAARTGSVDVTIDATSVNTGYALFNEHIQAADYFDTAKYPTITFKSSKMNFKGDEPVSLEGDLTIKGVTQPVTLTVTHFKCMPHPMLKVPACGANATATVKRSDFNMGKNVPYVGDDITLSLAIEAMKVPAAAK
ncbi:MAG TPA: YceI family protein [Thiobacillus sp.]|nr:MAG: polyisoprenoid-binding protein [Hydrogenophilales bacterium 28-61-11]OYZ57704.1 MAG: polyisoprenoid-binding protein [Hydrogenophilales bacterium 16-61-112]OZA46765.1 MAG: polyisoprenoid-binding protein [Hydrogenophilales bacterium 17-61-76]HQT70360.1 YceI family protein [Thiobacillus sp.]